MNKLLCPSKNLGNTKREMNNTERKVCRACAFECDKYRSLHKEGYIMGEITTLAKLLSFCIDMDFPSEELDMPTDICENCIQKLAKSYKFKQQVLLANEHFRTLDEATDMALTDDTVHAEYVMLGFVANNESDEEFILTEPIPIESEKIGLTPLESIEEIQDSNVVETVRESEVVEHEELELTGDASHDVIDEQENNMEIEEIDSEMGTEESVSSKNVFSIKSVNIEKEEAYPNYVISMLDGDEENIDVRNCELQDHDEFISEVDDENSQSDERSPSHSYSQSQDSDAQSDVVDDKLIKLVPKLKPVKKRKIKTNPKEPRPDLQCEVCGKQLSNPNSYRYHMQLHSDNTPYLCSLCGEGFKTRNAYDGHKAIHDPNNPNKCELCGKTYRQASSLRAHMLTHTGEKPFVCDICGKGMTQKSGYKKHMLTHTGEKPHVCDFCGREFRYSSNLIAHRRCHTGEKPYECSICTKCFISSEQLKRHKVVHTGDRPHKCDICDRRFKRRAALLQHTQLHANDNSKSMEPAHIIEEKTTKSNIIEIY